MTTTMFNPSLRRRRSARHAALALSLTTLMAAGAPLGAQQQSDLQRFDTSTSVNIVSVDVVVRDSKGDVVPGLTAKDFTILEDGKQQKIETFSFQEVGSATASNQDVSILEGLEDKLREEVKRAASATASTVTAAPTDAPDVNAVANRRMMVLLFDVSSMQPEDTQRAVEQAQQHVEENLGPSDLMSVVTIGSRLNVLSDFTSSKEDLNAALLSLSYENGTAVNPEAIVTAVEEAAADSADASAEASAFEEFNNDVRLQALKSLCDTIGPLPQRKAVLYFSAGMRTGDDNQIALRAATNACNRGNVLLYTVDARGLTAVVAGGGASSRGQSGQGLFSGASARRGMQQLNSSQETLTTLAADTGGRAFTNSNDFGEAFARVQRDLAAFYLLGYSSTNDVRDGKFRRITVRVNRPDLKDVKIEARNGYYAGRAFTYTNRRDREAQLDDQIAAAVSSTDMPMIVGTGFFRQANNSFYVPIAVTVPGFAVPVGENSKQVTLDVKGEVRDEQGRTVARIVRDTLEVPSAGATDTLAGRQIFYQTGVTLPPGRYSAKIVMRENTGGAIGSFEAPIFVPQLGSDDMKVSSIVMSTQVQKATGGKSDNPLVRDGSQLLPNLTKVVGRNQKIYFYYEVYDPAVVEQAPQLRTSMAFYRGGVKVFETPMIEKTTIDEPNRRAVVFQYEVPAEQFQPGTYTCQINIIDAVASKVSFPRLSFAVMN